MFYIISGLATCLGQSGEFPAPPGDLVLNNKEEVFIHYNSTFLLAGESLYYKFYCLDPDTGKLKDLSKVGYLELTGEDGSRVFLHKISLENGSGYGDFLIPSTVPSGSYKILGYTRWMKNAGKDHFFKGDLVVVNPYMEDQSRIIKVEDSNQASTISVSQQDPSEERNINSNNNYSLNTNGESFGKRERVRIAINKLNNGSVPGNFSLSVKRAEEFEIPQVLQATTYRSLYQSSNWNSGSNVILPDLRGQVITGKLKGIDGVVDTGGRSVVFSLPGKPFFIRIAKTAADGSFLFNVETRNFGSTAYLQVLGKEKDKFEIILDEVPMIQKENLEFEKFRVTPSIVDHIRERSIYNQVENSYKAVKQDSIIPEGPSVPFYGSLPEMYDLDAYTRFPTLQETFLEIIQLARISRNRDGTSQFEMVSGTGASGLKSLLIVDGLIVQDHENFVDFDARRIKSIGLQRKEYYLGPEVFKGLIAVETINGEFLSSLNRNFIKSEDFQNFQFKKEYFQPPYQSAEDRNSRVPDYRLQLLWKPVVEVKDSKTEIEFYTSDVPGKYEIILEGFTENGDAVSLKKVINVE